MNSWMLGCRWRRAARAREIAGESLKMMDVGSWEAWNAATTREDAAYRAYSDSLSCAMRTINDERSVVQAALASVLS